MKKVMQKMGIVLCCAAIGVIMLQAKPTTLNRNEISSEYKWDLSHIYPDWESWEKDILVMQNMMIEYSELKGKIGLSADNLAKAFTLSEQMGAVVAKISYYPGLMRAADGTDQSVMAKMMMLGQIYTQFAANSVWFTTEFFEIPKDTVTTWITENAILQRFSLEIESIYRSQQYILSEECEKLLTQYAPVISSPSTIYSQLTTADKKYPEITLSTGEKIILSNTNYSKIMKNEALTSEDRKLAYYTFNNGFTNIQNTLAAIYDSIGRQQVVTAQSRKYESVLHMHLFGNKIPVSVYENLVKTTRLNTKDLQRYLQLKKTHLLKKSGQNELKPWDAGIPLTNKTKEYSYDEAKVFTLASAEFFGKEYHNTMKTALESGWIDVYENYGKYAVAGTFNVYGVHPYVSLNYNDSLHYIFVLCHEMGHAIHSYYSIMNQPYSTHNPSIFVAEVASTMNERILLEYLLEHTDDSQTRLALLQQAIGNYINLFFNATMMAEFELRVSKLAEQYQPLTADTLNSVMSQLESDYFAGIIKDADEFKGILWTKVDHMYSQPFYLYQYATSFAASAKLYKDMTVGSKKSREAAKQRYLELLKSGSNDYPMEQLKKAGVDMNDPEVIKAVIRDFKILVDRLEKELARK